MLQLIFSHMFRRNCHAQGTWCRKCLSVNSQCTEWWIWKYDDRVHYAL